MIRLARRALAIASIAALALALVPPGRAEATPVRRRAVPSYDGRGPRPPTVGESLLWIPRVALFPLYLVSEYLFRIPIGYVISMGERLHVDREIRRVVHPTPNVYFTPTMWIDLGLVASVGLYLRADHALLNHNSLHVHGSTGGDHFWFVSVVDRYEFLPSSWAGVRATYLERANWRYYGLYDHTRIGDEQQFGWGRWDLSLFADCRTLQHLGLDATMGLRFDHYSVGRARPVRDEELLTAYENERSVYQRIHAYVDSRPPTNASISGARLEGSAQLAGDLGHLPTRRWLSFDLEGSVFLEVRHPGRVIALSAYGAMVRSLSSDPVSFTNLATLGGVENMHGFLFGRFRGDSALVFTAAYRYPVWWGLDGTIFVEAGNAYRGAFEGFDVRQLYGSMGLGFRTSGDRDLSIDVLFAMGTSRFDEPFHVDSFRLALGVNRGF